MFPIPTFMSRLDYACRINLRLAATDNTDDVDGIKGRRSHYVRAHKDRAAFLAHLSVLDLSCGLGLQEFEAFLCR